MTAEISLVVLDDEHIGVLSSYMMCGWPLMKCEVGKERQQYWSCRNEILAIDGITVEGREITRLAFLQKKTLDQWHISYMGVEKTRLFVYFQVMQPKDKTLSHKIPGKPWETLRVILN